MLRPIYVVRWNYAPERHFRKGEGRQLAYQTKACRGRQRAPWRGVENKELQTKLGGLLIVCIRSQRVKLIGQAIRAMRLTLLRSTKPGSWHVSPAPAAHPHSLAPPQQLSKPGLWHVSPAPQITRTAWHHLVSDQSLGPGMYRQRLQLIRTAWQHLISYHSLVPGMHRERLQQCSSYAPLGTTSQLSPRLPSLL